MGNIFFKNKLLLSLILFFTVFTSDVYAFPHYNFKKLSIEDGLSQSTVTCALKDAKGIMWIGTTMGLNRFDQYELKNYLHETDVPNALPDNHICFILEDAQQNLWVGSLTGLTQYNRNDDNFKTLLLNETQIQARTAILVDDGVLFCGTHIWKYCYKSKSIKKLPIVNNDKAISDYFGYIEHWYDDIYIVGTRWKGLYLYELTTGKIQPFEAITEEHIIAYCIDKKNNLWISPYGKGAYCYNKEGQLLAKYNSQNSNLNNDIILDFGLLKNELWMATDGAGIACLNLDNQEIKHIAHQQGNVNSFPAASVNCLYIANPNSIWAGTIRDGIINIHDVYMQTYQQVPLNSPFGLSNKTALSIYEEDNYIYVGTEGGGLNRFDKTSLLFKHFPSTYDEMVVDVAGYNNDELIVSFYGKGLFFFNKHTGTYRTCHFLGDTLTHKLCNLGLSIRIYRYSKGKYYILSDQAYFYDSLTNTLTPAQISGALKEANLVLGNLRVIFNNENYSYLYSDQNIFRLNNTNHTITPIYYTGYNNIIKDACYDYSGNLWIASNKGLKRFDLNTSDMESIETPLISEARRVVYDQAGRLWVGSKGHLFLYSIKDNVFTLFDESDGVMVNEYIPCSSSHTKNGDIYLCGSNGLLQIGSNHFNIYPSNVDVSNHIGLMDVLINGAKVNNKISDKNELELPYDFTSLTVKLIENTDHVFRHRIYRFHVSHLNNYIESYTPTLSLYSLPPGKYDIAVSLSNRNNTFTTPIHVLALHIKAPWWNSWWFKLIAIIAFIGCTIYYFYHINRKKTISMQWEVTEHKQKADEQKIRFLINLSHELRTPLMLIYSPLKRLLKNNNTLDDHTRNILEHVCIQSGKMKNIIQMVLDVRQIEMGKDTLQLTTYPFNEWLKEVAENFMFEYSSKNAILEYHFDERITEWTFDSNKCEIIVSNLLVNALKFSPEGSKIELSTSLENDKIRVFVRDEGVGLTDEDLQHLFERFYKGKTSKEGNGIGLSYAKTLLEQQGGNINAYNNETKGATFFFELPRNKNKEANKKNTNISLNDFLRFSESKRDIKSFEEVFELNKYSILIVEDNIELSILLKESLLPFFQKVFIKSCERDAVLVATQKLPDVILSNVTLESGNGISLCRQLKTAEKTKLIPFVLLSSQSDAESIASGYSAGADIFLQKPIDIDDLITILRNLLKNRKQLQNYYRSNDKYHMIIEEDMSNIDEKFTLKINNLIIDNLNNSNLSVEFLAEKLGMSRTSLYNKAKTTIKMSLSDYINNYRIEKAIEMLTKSDSTILEISEAIGFNNQRYFSTFFKKMTGFTPSQYRDKQKE